MLPFNIIPMANYLEYYVEQNDAVEIEEGRRDKYLVGSPSAVPRRQSSQPTDELGKCKWLSRRGTSTCNEQDILVYQFI